MKLITNAKQLPQVFYGLHFYPGVAEYRTPGEETYRVFVSEQAIRKMGPSFAGKPVYVRHVNGVDLANLQEEADGYVMESFFNKADGKHWVKFLVVSDAGHTAIRNGWKLSNAYVPTSVAPGGMHNSVEFQKEVVDGEYEHLAIVDDPRYEESVILTPEQFKEYNAAREVELERLANSNNEGEKEMGLNLFKRTKVENSADFENTLVQLPKSKKELSLAQLVGDHDAILNMNGYANDEHMVKLDDEEMTVKDLAKKYTKMKNMEKEAAEKAAAESEKAENEADQDEEKEPKLGNDDGEDEPMENDQDEEKEPKLGNSKKPAAKPAKKKVVANSEDEEEDDFEKIMNAGGIPESENEVLDTSVVQLQRGKDRYGKRVAK